MTWGGRTGITLEELREKKKRTSEEPSERIAFRIALRSDQRKKAPGRGSPWRLKQGGGGKKVEGGPRGVYREGDT